MNDPELPSLDPEMPFEKALEGLETVIRGMQAQDAELLQSIEAYERGVAFQKVCELRLNEAEARIEEIRTRSHSTDSSDLTLAPFGDGSGSESPPAPKAQKKAKSAKAASSAHDESDPNDDGELF